MRRTRRRRRRYIAPQQPPAKPIWKTIVQLLLGVIAAVLYIALCTYTPQHH